MTNLLAARQMDPAVRIIHNTIRLAGEAGLAEASIAVMTGLCPGPLARALRIGAARGVLSLVDSRWIAWNICPGCGLGPGNRRLDGTHLTEGVCDTPPADRCAGYPLTN